MKKILFITVCLIMMSMTASADTFNKAMLVHNGQVTLYDADKVQDAINASSDGDVIYLTLGSFKPFNVTKNITIRGVGETSIINGDVTISIPGSPKLTNPVLEALTVAGTVTVGAQVDNLILRKCKITKLEFNAQVDGVVVDRCNITTWLALSSYIKGITVVNTFLNLVYVKSGASNTTFVNCYISRVATSNLSATIINSIIQYGGSTSYPNNTYNITIESSVLLNTLINTNYVTIGQSSVAQDCYKVNNPSTDKASLQSKGYLGNDGTVVGPYGGDTPYTLEPSVPKVTSSDVKLDNDKKQLNVKLTVSPQ